MFYYLSTFCIMSAYYVESNYAHFDLLKESDRQILQKEIVFPWKTDAFKGKVKVKHVLELITSEFHQNISNNGTSTKF